MHLPVVQALFLFPHPHFHSPPPVLPFNLPFSLSFYLEPINIFHGVYKNDNSPIRLSYHGNIHYNSVVDPYEPSVGVGLGLAGYKPGVSVVGVFLCVVGVLLCVVGVILCVVGVLLCVVGVLLCVVGTCVHCVVGTLSAQYHSRGCKCWETCLPSIHVLQNTCSTLFPHPTSLTSPLLPPPPPNSWQTGICSVL